MIRILLTDDHKMMREALCAVLDKETDMSVAGEAGDGKEALQLCRELLPDVVLMDIDLPDMSGIEVTRRIIAEFPAVRVLAVSTYIDRRFIAGMLDAGATGYIHKAAGRDEVLQGIRAVAAGTTYLSQNVAAMLAHSPEQQEAESTLSSLGKRETEVLRLIAEGRTSAQIAAQLHIASGTAEVHRYNIMRKLNLHSVAELTKYAIREGLVTP